MEREKALNSLPYHYMVCDDVSPTAVDYLMVLNIVNFSHYFGDRSDSALDIHDCSIAMIYTTIVDVVCLDIAGMLVCYSYPVHRYHSIWSDYETHLFSVD